MGARRHDLAPQSYSAITKKYATKHLAPVCCLLFFWQAPVKEEKFIQELAKDHTRVLLGYVEREEGFYPLYAPGKGYIVTQAFILCKYCNCAISPNMGPRYDAVCLTCYEKDPDERPNT